jgi:hypothetical protein
MDCRTNLRPLTERGFQVSSNRTFRLVSALVLVATSGCASHVNLMTPETAPGSRYTCQEKGGCQPATEDVPSDLNPSGTTSVTLPRQCGGRFNRIFIHDAGSSNPKVDVTCAPAEESIKDNGPIDEME